VIPCAILAIPLNPYTLHHRIFRILWSFGMFLEAVSVMPQLRLMQNAKVLTPFLYLLYIQLVYKFLRINIDLFYFWLYIYIYIYIYIFFFFQMIEPFTAHYVFALGVSRFLACAHWIIQVRHCAVP
jgi:ER lumen protein retaining receptor